MPVFKVFTAQHETRYRVWSHEIEANSQDEAIEIAHGKEGWHGDEIAEDQLPEMPSQCSDYGVGMSIQDAVDDLKSNP